MNEPESEYIFDAANEHSREVYTFYLWAKEQIAIQGKQKSAAQREEPVQQTETFWWNAKTGQRSKPCTTKRVPVSLLRATGTKAADWTKRQSPESRKRKNQGTGKGVGEMALQRVREADKGNGAKDYPGTYDDDWNYYNLTRGNTK